MLNQKDLKITSRKLHDESVLVGGNKLRMEFKDISVKLLNEKYNELNQTQIELLKKTASDIMYDRGSCQFYKMDYVNPNPIIAYRAAMFELNYI